jgi:hypothetical protein
VAVAVLGLLLVVGIGLTAAIVGLAKLGLKSADASSSATSLLAVPAPGTADGLPRHVSHVRNDVTDHLVAEFTRRFDAIVGRYTNGLAALYREPGTVDLATGQPGWVMYLGYNSPANLGVPRGTVQSVMADLIGSSAPGSSWAAAPGPRGGSARCAITRFGATTVSLCAWATERTVGALMSPTADTRGKELAALMPLMRLNLQRG